MAEKEMYDYLSQVTVDNDYTLSLFARGTVVERGGYRVEVHEGDDISEERIILSSGDPVFYLTIPYGTLSPEDSGTVIDAFYDQSKGYGMAKSFKYAHSDNHTYAVRFATDMSRAIRLGSLHQITTEFKVLGYI